ncbi:MAG: hypothetical protein CMJ18_03000 [Phycisphaeraceae bacterium]|nr:hypothetical protein [Phycisphaeraceae bacterium]
MRTLIPLLAVGVGVAFVVALFLQGSGRDQDGTGPDENAPAQETAESPETVAAAPEETGTEPAPPDAASAPETPDETPESVEAASPPIEPIGALSILPAENPGPTVIGSDDEGGEFRLRVELSHSGLRRVSLADYRATVYADDPYVLQSVAEVGDHTMYPFGALDLTINGTRLSVLAARWDLNAEASGASATEYVLHVVDGDGKPVLDVTRRFEIRPESYGIVIRQRFANRTDQPLEIVWRQLAQADATIDRADYLGDRRALIAGYFDPPYDSKRSTIFIRDTHLPRTAVLDAYQDENRPFWPNEEIDGHETAELVWFASLNRYFAVALHPLVPESGRVPDLETDWDKLSMVVLGKKGEEQTSDGRVMAFSLRTRPFIVSAGATERRDLGIFCGPRRKLIFQAPPFRELFFDKMRIYSLGGPCAFCTFQWLAHGLLAFLTFLHDWLFGDWGLAIILLVLCVRALLHPITKRSQVNMMKMGKQMQSLQPEIEKIKKRYGDDTSRISQETMKLYREKGVNPANMLGCLPMLLQMPIWIALYAMLYFAIELRHEHAFYGIFQLISGGAWDFLRDLSGPDRFISFFDEPRFFRLWLFSFDYSSINILPVLMAVVFFIQQKLTMTPAATEDQRRQQKIMGYVTLIFPVIMYSMPSGLTLYIMSSTAIGIYESYLVRKHIREQEEGGTLFAGRKPPRPGGFMDRMHKAVEAKQKQAKDRDRKVNGGDRPNRPNRPKRPKK